MKCQNDTITLLCVRITSLTISNQALLLGLLNHSTLSPRKRFISNFTLYFSNCHINELNIRPITDLSKNRFQKIVSKFNSFISRNLNERMDRANQHHTGSHAKNTIHLPYIMRPRTSVQHVLYGTVHDHSCRNAVGVAFNLQKFNEISMISILSFSINKYDSNVYFFIHYFVRSFQTLHIYNITNLVNF